MNVYDLAYALGVTLTTPLWVARGKSRRKVLCALRDRNGRVPHRDGDATAVLVHAVSVGELNAARLLVDLLLKRHPGWHVIVSTTTTAGWERACQLYADRADVTAVRFPLDFSAPINRFLNALRPAAVVLMELEVWPNFMRACHVRGIPVLLANGRVTLPSYRRYRLAGGVSRRMFARLAAVCAQEQEYAGRFIRLGAHPARTRVTGTMKFDTAPDPDAQRNDAALVDLALQMRLAPGVETLWLAGSTGPGEEAILLDIYRKLLPRFVKLRLMIVPRKPERFDEVDQLIRDRNFSSIRRSRVGQRAATDRLLPTGRGDATAAEELTQPALPPLPVSPVSPVSPSLLPPVLLGDTIGELRRFYELADFVFVGRSLVDLGARQHGSDMIEPAALGKPLVIGRFTGNFAEVMRRLRAADACIEVGDADELFETMTILLGSADASRGLGERAQAVVRSGRGATMRHVTQLEILLNAPARRG